MNIGAIVFLCIAAVGNIASEQSTKASLTTQFLSTTVHDGLDTTSPKLVTSAGQTTIPVTTGAVQISTTENLNEVTWKLFWITTGILFILVVLLLVSTMFLLCQYFRNHKRESSLPAHAESTVLSNMYTNQDNAESDHSRFDGPNEINDDYHEVTETRHEISEKTPRPVPRHSAKDNPPYGTKQNKPELAPKPKINKSNPPKPGPKPIHMQPQNYSQTHQHETTGRRSPTAQSEEGYDNDSDSDPYDDNEVRAPIEDNLYETAVFPGKPEEQGIHEDPEQQQQQPVYDEVNEKVYENEERLV